MMHSTHAAAMGAPSDLDDCPLMPTYPAPTVRFVKGAGTELWDGEGRRYLDFLSGLAVCSLGHAHPRVARALASQAETLLHVSNLFGTEPGWEVARRLEITPKDRTIQVGGHGRPEAYFRRGGRRCAGRRPVVS